MTLNNTCLSKEIKSVLGGRFKSARREKGYELDYTAFHAEIAPVSTLFLFEEGLGDLPLDRVYALANVLEISPSHLMEWVFYSK